MTVQASSAVLDITVVKSRSTTIRTATAELRLKSGDVKYDDTNRHRIKWAATPDAGKSWLTLDRYTGFVHSSLPVADVKVTVDSAGFDDTAQSGPLVTNITFRCEPEGLGMMSSDFVAGTDVRTIEVRLTIKAVPYVEAKDVAVATSSGVVVTPGDPISAGDQFTVTVKAFDAERIPISRGDLQLNLQLLGKMNTLSTQLPLTRLAAVYNATTGRNESNVYGATVPEDWIRNPEDMQLIISSGSAS
jgi:hypothetical protein